MSASTLETWGQADAAETVVAMGWAGAGAGLFKAWADTAHESWAVLGARLRGRETRIGEPPLETVEANAAEVADAILDRGLASVHLVGICSGALVALETARALEHSGVPCASIAVVSQASPQALASRSVASRTAIAEASLIGERLPARLYDVLRPAIEADLRAVDVYAPQVRPPLACPLAVVTGTRDDRLRPADLAGWTVETTGPVTRLALDGDHLFAGSAWAGLGAGVLDHAAGVAYLGRS